MQKQQSKGICLNCRSTFSRAGISRHLKSCGAAGEEQSGGPETCFLVSVTAACLNIYWLYLSVPVDARLAAIDSVLRETWLECCGHLSAFRIGDETFSSQANSEFGDLPMDVRAGAFLRVGRTFSYEYDFGSTTDLKLKVVGMCQPPLARDNAVSLLAVNLPVKWKCQQCDTGQATRICVECQWNRTGWMCDTCAAEHDCGAETWLPVVNSPRAGVCAYSGD